MTAAFILGINLFIAVIFAVAFGVVAATNRTARGAGWMASGYAMGIVNVVLEFMLRIQADPTPAAIGIFLVFLLGQTFCLIGVARHYRIEPPWVAIAAIGTASVLAIPFIFSLDYASPLRSLAYQLPYFAMHLLIAVTILRSRRRQALDLLLVALTVLTACLYLVRPLVIWIVGTASAPQGYMATTYAAISQSIGSVTLVALALVLLLVIMRDTASEMMARSETDALSGALNRRGFDAHAEPLLAQAHRFDTPLVLVTADLDHFKAINDDFGHAAGDNVIAHFAALLRNSAREGAIVSHLGGEEFAVLMPGADLAEGRLFAEAVRRALAAAPLASLGIDRTVTASFGAAQQIAGDTMFDLSRRADAALYRAKAGGRNRVGTALGEAPSASPQPRRGTA